MVGLSFEIRMFQTLPDGPGIAATYRVYLAKPGNARKKRFFGLPYQVFEGAAYGLRQMLERTKARWGLRPASVLSVVDGSRS
ncbi:MAG: hypothetical protein LBU23_01670, partial [Planctomycetota bacterium]|nr:hypothetical protein [Planctomycetota bacterium]